MPAHRRGQRRGASSPGRRHMVSAIATAHGFAVRCGSGRFRSDGAGPADTVYLGASVVSAWRQVGGFDDDSHRNQDYELNWRLRDAGHEVWFDPAIA